MKKTAIIVAGGSGLRAGGNLPKQLQDLAGLPVFAHSIKAFLRHDPATHIILAVNAAFTDMFRTHVSSMQQTCQFECTIVEGGTTRADSVLNALKALPDEADMLVAVHDAARPLVSEATIARGWEQAQTHGAVVPVVPLTDSIRHIDAQGNSRAAYRAEYVAVQTPQVFRRDVIMHAYTLLQQGTISADKVTDDASVAELAGYKIILYEGQSDNFKITGPHDLAIANLVMNKP